MSYTVINLKHNNNLQNWRHVLSLQEQNHKVNHGDVQLVTFIHLFVVRLSIHFLCIHSQQHSLPIKYFNTPIGVSRIFAALSLICSCFDLNIHCSCETSKQLFTFLYHVSPLFINISLISTARYIQCIQPLQSDPLQSNSLCIIRVLIFQNYDFTIHLTSFSRTKSPSNNRNICLVKVCCVQVTLYLFCFDYASFRYMLIFYHLRHRLSYLYILFT